MSLVVDFARGRGPRPTQPVFWIASNQPNVAPPVFASPTPVTPAPAPPFTAQKRAFAAALTCAPARSGPARCRSRPRSDSKRPRPLLPTPRPRRPGRSAAVVGAGNLRRPCSRTARRRAAAAARSRGGAAGSPGCICAQEPCATGRDLVPGGSSALFSGAGGGWAYRQPVDSFAQAAIVESPKRIVLLPPSARSMARLERKARSR